ncbi:hypothetical protein HDU98_011637 [Podochytrium sp. JEL0797]|nr:hypothetical protein HDU98_011637 [Podochytrium sp. JEL0797]
MAVTQFLASSLSSLAQHTQQRKTQRISPLPLPLYSGLSSEAKARAAVSFFASSPLSTAYSLRRVVGFGSNGVVLAAKTNEQNVAVKIIYKHEESKHAALPAEIESLRALKPSNHSIRLLADWQDERHFYIVTDLFGSDWLATQAAKAADSLRSLRIDTPTGSISLPFSAGSSDLWAWAYAHRAHVFSTEGHSMLPLHPIKQIVKQVALALNDMHSQGFFHGDVKIENVLVQSGGAAGPQTRLADFGHAKHASFGIKSYGTQEVSPPEFLADSPFATQDLDGRAADVFALGMVLYVLLNDHGELPTAAKKAKSGSAGYEQLLAFRNGEYPLDEMTDLDQNVWDLLFAMTRVDPSTRVSMDQVLAHPFFADV